MEIDRRRDDDAPSAHADAPGDAAKPEPADIEPDLHEPDKRAVRVGYQVTVEAVYLEEARQQWKIARPVFRDEWTDYKEAHPLPARTETYLEEAAADRVRRGCGEIREKEDKIVTPAMRRIEAEDPDRQLVGLEYRCKGEDRIMEKVATALEEQPDLTPGDALASVKDAIRYTFQYTEEHYAEGVYADVDRLKATGFELVELRNSWGCEEYKGINSRWRVPANWQLFEVQFHTEISFEAKQLTHSAYERIRDPATPDRDVSELRGFQRKVTAQVPKPRSAIDIPDHP
jgi:hypothetical protein